MIKPTADIRNRLAAATKQLEEAERNLDMAAAYTDMYQDKLTVDSEGFINNVDWLRYELIKHLGVIEKLVLMLRADEVS